MNNQGPLNECGLSVKGVQGFKTIFNVEPKGSYVEPYNIFLENIVDFDSEGIESCKNNAEEVFEKFIGFYLKNMKLPLILKQLCPNGLDLSLIKLSLVQN